MLQGSVSVPPTARLKTPTIFTNRLRAICLLYFEYENIFGVYMFSLLMIWN